MYLKYIALNDNAYRLFTQLNLSEIVHWNIYEYLVLDDALIFVYLRVKKAIYNVCILFKLFRN